MKLLYLKVDLYRNPDLSSRFVHKCNQIIALALYYNENLSYSFT